MSIKKNSNDPIGNRTCDLRACSAVPQSTAPSQDGSPAHFKDVQVYLKRKLPQKVGRTHRIKDDALTFRPLMSSIVDIPHR